MHILSERNIQRSSKEDRDETQFIYRIADYNKVLFLRLCQYIIHTCIARVFNRRDVSIIIVTTDG